MGREHDQLIKMIKQAIMMAADDGTRSKLEVETEGGTVIIDFSFVPENQPEEEDEEHG